MSIATVFSQMNRIMGICPHCAALFYLSEARPYLEGRRPRTQIDVLREREQSLERADQRLSDMESELRERAAAAGARTAKRLLKGIDRVFSGAGYDPQDVKVIFSPVNYVVFDGMWKQRMKRILLLAKPPENRAAERLQTSIASTIKKGHIEFQTLHVAHDGQVVCR